jgi:hypothetical protein
VRETGAVKVRKLILNGTPEDVERQRWADIGDDVAVEKTAEMIAVISGTCATTREHKARACACCPAQV